MQNPLLSLKDGKKTILIITGTKHSSDVVFAALAMHLALKDQGHDPHLLSSRLLSSPIWKHKLASLKKININGQPPSRYIFKLPPGFELKDISWEKDQDQILVKMDAQSFAKKIPPLKIQSSPLKPDLILYLGTNSGLDQIAKQLPQESGSVDKLLILPKKISFKDKDLDIAEISQSKSFSLKVFNLLKDLGIKIDKDAANYLLSGLIAHTNVFKKNCSAEMFLVIKNLIEIGADYQLAYGLGVKDLSLKKIYFLAELQRTTIVVAHGVYQAGLILNKPLKMRIEVEDLMKLTEIYDCDLAVVSISTPLINRTYIWSNSDKYDLKKLLKSLKGKGNKYQGVIESNGDIGQIHAQIYQELGIIGDSNTK
jgi:hypothetical protein